MEDDQTDGLASWLEETHFDYRSIFEKNIFQNDYFFDTNFYGVWQKSGTYV